MAKNEKPPQWFREKVLEINLRLIEECGMDWDDVLDFWQEIIDEARARIDEEN